MNPELFGVGRTWASVWATLAITGALLWFTKIDQDTWMITTLTALGLGAGKSSVQLVSRGKPPPEVPGA